MLRVFRTPSDRFAVGIEPGSLAVPDFAWERALGMIRALDIPFETPPDAPLPRPNERPKHADRWVVGLGEGSYRTASVWAGLHSRTLSEAGDLWALAGLLEGQSPSSLTLIIDKELFEVETLVSIHRLVASRGIPCGVVPVIDEATAAVAAMKGILHAHAGWRPGRRLIYSPTESRPSTAATGSGIVLGRLPADDVLRRLDADLDLLCVLTHSNGVDAYLGEGLFACANDDYDPAARRSSLPLAGGTDVLPCFGGDACNRGEGLLLRLRDLRTRVFVFLTCGGTLAADALFDVRRSLLMQLLENPWVEASFSSLGLFETWQSTLLAWCRDFLTQRTAGEAALSMTRRFEAIDPEGAELLVLVGDPHAPLSSLPTVRVDDARVDDDALHLSVSLPDGPALFHAPRPPALQPGTPLTILYTAEPAVGLDAIRGHAVAEGDELAVLLGSEVPVASLTVAVTRGVQSENDVTMNEVFRNLSTTKRYLHWAGGDPDLRGRALEEIARFEDGMFQAALLEIPLERVGGALDLRVMAARRGGFEKAVRRLHRTLLAWQESFARSRGSQPRKNWSSALSKVGRLTLAEPCGACGQPLTLERHASRLEPGVERFALTCRRCWHVGDFSYEGFPRSLHAPAVARAGDELELAVRFDQAGGMPLYVDGLFLLEDFHPGGSRSRSSAATALYVAPGAKCDLEGRVKSDPTLPAGRYVVSAHVLVNGGLNLLRRSIGILRGPESH